MAFRKTVRSVYEPSPYFGGFSEPKFKNIEDGSCSSFQKLKHIPPSELSLDTFPIVSPDALISSGQIIKGNVTFEPRLSAMQETATQLLNNIHDNNL